MVIKHTSKNGLRILVETVPNVRSVSIGIWVLTGSRNETVDNNGISHFLEHMFFKGTKTRTAQEIAEAFDSIGGQVNAFTSKEITCLYARVLDNHKTYALEVLADMFFNSTFHEQEIQREKKVVVEEINMYEDTPDELVHDLLAEATYENHPLGFPILGTEKQIESFSQNSLVNYMKNQYIPENIVVSIAGNVDETFIATVEKAFSPLQNEKSETVLTKPHFYSQQLEKLKDTEQAHVCIGYRGLPIHDEKIYSLVVMNNILGGSMSSRLFQQVREVHGLAYSVFSFHTAFKDDGLLTIYAGTAKERLSLLQQTIDEIIDSFIENGITEKELKNAKEQLKGNMMLSLESTSSRMSRNAKNELLLQRHRTIDEVIQEIEMVDQLSVQMIIEKVFKTPPSSARITPKSRS